MASSDGCSIAVFVILRLIHIFFVFPGLCILASFGTPAAYYMGGIEIGFLAVAGVCVVESVVMGFAPLFCCREKHFNPFHRFIFAAAVLGISIALIIRTVNLDTVQHVPKCQIEWKDGRDSKGKHTKTATVLQNQAACQLYTHRLIAGVTGLISGIIYFVTGFKETMRMRRKTAVTPPPGGRVFSVWTPEPQSNQYPASPVFNPYQQQPVAFPQYNPSINYYSNGYN